MGVGEVGPGETAKREIIHQLCIQPMAHSELSKMLPEDVSILPWKLGHETSYIIKLLHVTPLEGDK